MKAFTILKCRYLSSIKPRMNNQGYNFQKSGFYYIFVNKRVWELPRNTSSLTLGTYIKLQQLVKKVDT
ncbi:hypothetical protein C6370_02480 [Bacillus atrophaeus]|nr:hypothetical protein BaGK_08350 [Bacillus atrophaeus]PSA96234.1 hypothetical protein C6370_02480 [Bacillus atrophaeus]